MNKYLKYSLIAIIIIAVIALIVVLNLNRNNKDIDDGKVKIVTSFYPMYIIAENLTQGANNIELVNMADVNVGCLHDYTLTTEDMKKLEDADIFVANGLGMEQFIDKILESNSDMQIIDSSSNITNLISDGDETNGHIWTNIDNYIVQVKNIAEELKNSDPDNSAIYENNANDYVTKLEELKNEFSEELSQLIGEKAVILNEAFEYMGQELGLDMITVKTDHEESTLSAETLKNIIDTTKEQNIKIIIIDKNDNKSNAETISNEIGAKILELNSGLTGSLDRDAYIDAVRDNIEILKAIL